MINSILIPFRRFSLFVCITIILALPMGCVNDDPAGDGHNIETGDKLPQFSVTLNNGEEISDVSLQGNIGVIIFFNTSCPDCRKELPVIQELYEYYENNPNILILAISRQQNANSISEYWSENNLTIPWSAQNDKKIYNLFAQSGIPRIYISDPFGVITAIFGDSDLPSLETLIYEIQRAEVMPLK